MIEQLKDELKIDEGYVGKIYLDHLGKKTVGIGHLCRKNEPEYTMEVGSPVSDERVSELFEKDISWTINDCYRLLPDFDMLPETVRLIFANMAYNLGINRLGGFKLLIKGIEARDWSRAADEMRDSKWARQLPERSGRLIERMRGVS